MPEFRQNLATKEWIIIAAERAKRPEEFAKERPAAMEQPAYSPTCPFCPGNEGMTPEAILTIPYADPEGKWDVRVVPNKYPALVPSPDGEYQTRSEWVGPHLRRDGIGEHEIVVETPLHNRDLPLYRRNTWNTL